MLTDIIQARGITLKKKTAGEYSGACPWCGGTDRFQVWPDKNRYWCRGCGKKGDDIQLLRDLDGMTFEQAKEAAGRGNGNGKGVKTPPRNGNSKILERYEYPDEEGAVLFQVLRYEPKSFSQQSPDGKGAWRKTMAGVRLVLFRLPQVLKADEVAFCEGEKDVQSVEKLGLVATCNPMGAGKIQGQQEKHGILEPLRGKQIYILEHNDQAGLKDALQKAELLHPIAKEVKIIPFRDLPLHGDVSDFITRYGEKAKTRLIEKIAEIEPWKPPRVFFSAKDLLNRSFEKHRPVISGGILPHNGHMLIAGETGVGKSLLRMEMGLHLAMGWNWLGFDVSTAKKVVVFQYENPESTEQARLNRMCRGLGIDIRAMPENCLTYADRRHRVNLSLKGDRERLLEMVKQSEAEVIFYDCLSNLHAGDENKNMALREIVDVLTDINAAAGTACVLIHHFGKGGNPEARKIDRIRGASSLVDWSMTAITFTVRPHENKVLRQLDFVKVRDGATPKPILCERDENFLLTITDEDSLCPPGKVRELLEELGDEIDSQKPLVEAIISDTGCTDRSARKFIKRAVELDLIHEVGKGRGNRKCYRISKN